MNLDALIEQITAHHIFLQLKAIVENANGWHDHEPTFDHSVKTAEIAKREGVGNFITNEEAKTLFLAWMNEAVFDMPRKNILALTALLHDCGKVLQYKEREETKTLILIRPQTTDQTLCPGHEYWGGEIVVKEILKDLDIPHDATKHIAQLVTLHGTFNNPFYFLDRHEWSMPERISDIKSMAQGYYKEAMFNAYCDGYTATVFAPAKQPIEELFNEPSLYLSREYFIPV